MDIQETDDLERTDEEKAEILEAFRQRIRSKYYHLFEREVEANLNHGTSLEQESTFKMLEDLVTHGPGPAGCATAGWRPTVSLRGLRPALLCALATVDRIPHLATSSTGHRAVTLCSGLTPVHGPRVPRLEGSIGELESSINLLKAERERKAGKKARKLFARAHKSKARKKHKALRPAEADEE